MREAVATWHTASHPHQTMYHYHLHLVGLHILLQSHLDLPITQRAKPFVLPKSNSTPEHIWTLEPAYSLPPVAEQNCKNGLCRYSYTDGDNLVHHYLEDHHTPFCVTTLQKSGNILLQYDPRYAHYFSDLDSVFHYVGLESFLLQHGGLLLHASLILENGRTIAFTAPSGIGKSTQADLWRIHRSAEILNGDRSALRKVEHVWTAFGSPYAGSSGIYRNGSGPIAAIVVLKQTAENRITRLQGSQVLKYLYPELSLHRWDPEFIQKSTALLADLIQSVPAFLLECVPEESAVQLLHHTLLKGNLLP